MADKDLGKTATGMQANIEALLSYLVGFVTGIVFYLIEKDNKFVRFHALQSIVVFGGLWILGMLVWVIPFLGPVLASIIYVLEIVLWILLMVKAYRGEYFKLPLAGDIAEKHS